MIVDLSYSASANLAPSNLQAAWNTAALILSSMFTDNIQVNINVTYGVYDSPGNSSAWPGTQDDLSTTQGEYVSYQTVYNYLTQHASPGDTTFTGLPHSASFDGYTQVYVFNSQLKLMGSLPFNAPTIDGSADFGTGIPQSAMVGVALHEFTHALGRVPYGPPFDSGPDIFDLFRYTGAGNPLVDGDTTSAPAAYFSLNDGLSRWADYGQAHDPSDFLNYPSSPLTPDDAFNEIYDSPYPTFQYLSPVDLEQMDALGFHLKYDALAANYADFNGNGSGDILIENSAGQIDYANMSGGVVQNWVNVTTVPGWTVVGEGKISGGPDSDIVIQFGSTFVVGNLVNGSWYSLIPVGTATGFNVVGVADVNDDHYADIIIQNPVTSEVGYANMHNGVFTNWFSLADPVGWTVPAVGDINYDGYADIVIQNKITDEVGYGNLKNGVVNNWVSIADPVGWKVVGAGPITGAGDADIVIQNRSTADIAYANIENGALNNFVDLGTAFGWKVVNAEDILGNGFDDIVIQNTTSGAIAYANMTGGLFHGWVNVGDPAGFTAFSGAGTVESSAFSTASAGPQSGAAPAISPSDLLYSGPPGLGLVGGEGGGIALSNVGTGSLSGATAAIPPTELLYPSASGPNVTDQGASLFGGGPASNNTTAIGAAGSPNVLHLAGSA